MITNEYHITIDRAADDVFAYITDHSNFPHFNSIIEPTTILAMTPPAVGSQFTLNVQVGGESVPVTFEVTRYDPFKTFAYRTVSGAPVSMIVRYFLEEVGHRTRVIYNQELEPGDQVDEQQVAEIERTTQERLENDLGVLKATLEAR